MGKRFLMPLFLLAIIIAAGVIINYIKDNWKSNLYIEPSSGNHTHTIIFLPGISNKPEDFEPLFRNKMQFQKKNTTKIVILRPKLHSITALYGLILYSWFDVYNYPLNSSNDFNFEELKKASNLLKEIIEEEAEELEYDYEKIIIGGHSQGAMIALFTGYTFEEKIGGVFSWSGVLPPLKRTDISKDKENLNVYLGYGDKDDKVNPEYYSRSINEIKDFKGLNVVVYPNHEHYVNSEEKKDVGLFLDKIM